MGLIKLFDKLSMHGIGRPGISFGGMQLPIVGLATDREDIASFEATTGWTVLGDDTTTLATSTNHITGALALSFAKVDGLDNTKLAGIQKTITSVDLSRFSSHDYISTSTYISDVTNTDYVFVRLGTDSSNYTEWQKDEPTVGWDDHQIALSAAATSSTGNGWDQSAVTYVAVGVAFDAEGNALAGIIFDHLNMHTHVGG